MDRLKIERAHIVGYSMGGQITKVLLAERPERLRTAVIGGAGWMDPRAVQTRQNRMEEIAQSLEQGKGVGPLIAPHVSPSQAPTPQQLEAFNKLFLSRNDPLALAAVARRLADLQPPEAQLRTNKTPALALIGELDPNKPGVDRLQRILPNLNVVVIPGANHLSAITHPEFLANLKAFLAEHDSR